MSASLVSSTAAQPARVSPVAGECATVCFNGRFIDQELTGVQRYARGMLASFGAKLRVVRPSRPLSPIHGHVWEQFSLARQCGDSLLWSPGNSGPLAKANQVVTIHDASTLDHPEWFSGKFAAWYRFLLPRLARRVRKIITVSAFSKERLIATCGIPPEKIAVIPNAIDARFQPASPEAIEGLRQKHRLVRPYFLYVGSLEPRKNVSVLLQAWSDLALADHDLILAGTPGHVFREKGFADLPRGARLFGRVADDELPPLLSGARGFVFPSLYEGFGFPPLEAMACGCPAICSGSTSLPEVGGPAFRPGDPADKGAVLYFDPASREELADQIRSLLAMSADAARRMTLNGIARAGLFDWGTCAAKTWAAINELAAG